MVVRKTRLSDWGCSPLPDCCLLAEFSGRALGQVFFSRPYSRSRNIFQGIMVILFSRQSQIRLLFGRCNQYWYLFWSHYLCNVPPISRSWWSEEDPGIPTINNQVGLVFVDILLNFWDTKFSRCSAEWKPTSNKYYRFQHDMTIWL